MHELVLFEIVKRCQQRQREGDHPTEPPFSVEQLEDAVVQLAAQVNDRDQRLANMSDVAMAAAQPGAKPVFCKHCPFAKHVHYEENGRLVAPGCDGFEPQP